MLQKLSLMEKAYALATYQGGRISPYDSLLA